MNPIELERRLIDFSVLIIKISDNLPPTRSGNTLSNQIVRAGTSVALNYGEARSAESNKDFIHKCQVVLKELRETYIALQIILKSEMMEDRICIDNALIENNELISIFVATINKMKRKTENDK